MLMTTMVVGLPDGKKNAMVVCTLSERENIVNFCIRQAQRVKLVINMNTFLYYIISDLKIRFKR